MLPNVFKSSKSIDFDKLMKAYIVKNYDVNSYTQDVQCFIAEFQQNRNIALSLNDRDKTYDSLKSSKDILINYLTMLNVIKSKMNFGKDDFSIKVEFSWKDVLKNDYWSSLNVSLEYYSNLFNLAVLYFLLGSSISSSDEEVKLKEAIKYFQYASWLFDNIKNELPNFIPQKETPTDLSQNYLTYCSYICMAYAQSYLLTVAERKKSSFELQGQLAKGIFDLYTSAFQIANESLKKALSDESRIYINNRRFYYVSVSFAKMKDQILEEFNKTGEGYGKAIAYLGLACDSMNNAYKDIKRIKHLVDVEAFEALKAAQENLGAEMMDKNSRIYYHPVPELASLPKLDKKIMVNPQQHPENLNSGVESGISVLDALVPREVKGMIENYKRSMMEYVSENLNNYQNEALIVAFLIELNLPYSLETVLSQNEISDSLWKKISDVQQKGGSMFITNNISNLEKKAEEIARRINDMLQIIANEESEDQKYVKMYGDRWVRTASGKINGQYINVLQDFAKKLAVAQNCDLQIKNGMMDSMKFFELLGLSKSVLSNRIPVKTDVNAIKNCEEAVALRKDLDALDQLKEKCMDIINKIFQTLNEDNIIPQFIKVLQKKTTEKSIFSDNKPKYEAMFKELDAVSEEIKLMKLAVTVKNGVFLRVKQSTFKPCEENEKFFRDLEDYCQMYSHKLINLQQGMNFYTEFNRRLNEINSHITDFLMSRDLEKNEVIRSITTGGYFNKQASPKPQVQMEQNNNCWDFTNTNSQRNYLDHKTYLDPNKNLITNLNTNTYSYGGYYNNMASNQNQNQNQNMSFNSNQNQNVNQNVNQNNKNFNTVFGVDNNNNNNNNSGSNGNINRFPNSNTGNNFPNNNNNNYGYK